MRKSFKWFAKKDLEKLKREGPPKDPKEFHIPPKRPYMKALPTDVGRNPSDIPRKQKYTGPTIIELPEHQKFRGYDIPEKNKKRKKVRRPFTDPDFDPEYY